MCKITLFVKFNTFVAFDSLHLLVRDVSNRWKRYKIVSKRPKSYRIILGKQVNVVVFVVSLRTKTNYLYY